jgi:DNA-binding MarR family transcriptional regulator
MRTRSVEPLTLTNLGFLLAKASQRFNEELVRRFTEAGFGEVRAAYGSLLMPLFAEDGLRPGQISERARLSKQSMTRLVAQCEGDGLVRRRRDDADGRAFRIELTERGHQLRSVARAVLADLDDEIAAALGREDRDALERALKGVMDL